MDRGALDDKPADGRPGREVTRLEAIGEDRDRHRRGRHLDRGRECGHVARHVIRPDRICVRRRAEDGGVGVGRDGTESREERPVAEDLVPGDGEIVRGRVPREGHGERRRRAGNEAGRRTRRDGVDGPGVAGRKRICDATDRRVDGKGVRPVRETRVVRRARARRGGPAVDLAGECSAARACVEREGRICARGASSGAAVDHGVRLRVEGVRLDVERLARGIDRGDRDRRARDRDLEEVVHLRRGGRDRRAAACGPAAVRVGPPDGKRVVGAAGAGRLGLSASAACDVTDEAVPARAQRRCVSLVDVGVPIEGDVHTVRGEQPLKAGVPLEVRVAVLGRLIREQGVVKERELQARGMSREVGLQPQVLRAGRRPVGEVVRAVRRARADVSIRPGRGEHVEAGVPGGERIPGTRVGGGRRAVRAAVRVHLVPACRRGDGGVLRPVQEMRMGRIVPGQTVVPDDGEEREGAAHAAPERHPEDARACLLQVAVVTLAPRRVSVVARGDREAGAACRDLPHDVGLVDVGARRVGFAPVAEHGEREGLRRADRHLCRERRREIGPEQVHRAEVRPVAERAGRGQAEVRLPLILEDRVHRDRHAGAGRHGHREGTRAPIGRAEADARRSARPVRRKVDDRVQAHEVGQVRHPSQVRVEWDQRRRR